MRTARKLAISVSSGALAFGLLVAPSASAENNYAPGLPAPTAGQPNNPPTAAPIVPSVVLVNQSVAAKASPIDIPRPPAPRVGTAPKASAEVRKPVALEVTSLTPGTTYVVQIKRKGGSYGTLGSVVPTANGDGTLPVFRPTRKGVYILALVDQKTGNSTYVKVTIS